MNIINHFLTSFIFLYVFFIEKVIIIEIIIFSLIFGVLIDLNQLIGRKMGKPSKHTRTWIEEPFGLIFIGIPIGIILSLIKKEYFFLTIIPFGLHILLDYVTIHEVSPLAPFSKKNINMGFFKSNPPPSWYSGKEKGIPENYFLILNIIIVIIIARIII
jgi:membrane-bound metal-dependent hydrolase YbcI (DUF457 family)